MTIYAYIHTVGTGATERQVLATTYDVRYVPSGVSAVEFPDGTPLALVNGVIQSDYVSRLGKVAEKKLAEIKAISYQTIGQGFGWKGNQVTLSSQDQANNQLSLSVAGFSSATAKPWTSSTAVTPTSVISASGTYWHPLTSGTTGKTEPNWGNASPITDGSVSWQEILFQVGTDSGNIWVNVSEALELGVIGGTFISSQRSAYQAAKTKLVTLSNLPNWSQGNSYSKGAQIFVPTTGGVWKTTKPGKSGPVFPLFEQTGQVIPDGATAWSYVGQAETLIGQVTL